VLLAVLWLVLQMLLHLFQVYFEFLLRRFEILFLELHVGLLPMDYFLQSAHRVKELLAQVDHLLAILAPKVFKDLGRLNLHGLLLALQFLLKFRVLLLPLRQLVRLALDFLVHSADLAVETCVLTVKQLELVPKLVQVEQPTLLRVGQLRP